MFFFLFSLRKRDNCVILRKQTHASRRIKFHPMHVMRGSNLIEISEIFTCKFVFWNIFNRQLVYFIPLLVILTILDQRGVVFFALLVMYFYCT